MPDNVASSVTTDPKSYRHLMLTVAFTLAVMLLAWLMRDTLVFDVNVNLGIAITATAVLFVTLSLMAVRVSPRLFVGLQFVPILALFLASGTLPAVIAAYLGAFAAQVVRIFLNWPGFRRAPMVRGLIDTLFDAGWSVCAVLSGGAAYVWLGGTLPFAGTNEQTVWQILPLLVVTFTVYQIPLFVPLVAARAKRDQITDYLLHAAALAFLTLAAIPLALLLALVSRSPGAAVSMAVLVLALIGLAVLFRTIEGARQHLVRQVRELERFSQIGQSLGSSLALGELTVRLEHYAADLVEIDGFALGLNSPDLKHTLFPHSTLFGQPWKISVPTRDLMAVLVDRVVKTGKPLRLNGSVRAQAAMLNVQATGSDDFAAFLSVPMATQGRVLGALAVYHKTARFAFGGEAVSMLTMLADRSATLVSNALLYGQTTEMAEKLALLNNVSAVVTATLDLETVLETICNVAIEVGNADQTGVFLANEDQSALQLAYSVGLSDDFKAQLEHVATSPQSGPVQILNSWTSLAITDVRSDLRALGWQSLSEIEGIRSMLTVPLIATEKVIGFMACFYKQRHVFEQSELDLMNTLGNQMAVTISNARLHRVTQQRAQEMQRLVEASRAFTATLDLDSVADAVLNVLVDVIGPDFAALTLATTDYSAGSPLHFLAHRGAAVGDTLTVTRSIDKVIQHRQAVRLPDDQDDLDMLHRIGLRALHVLPIVNQDRTIGLALFGYKGDRALSVGHRQLAEAVLNQASTAILNAQLFNQVDTALDERVEELRAVEKVSRTISASLDVDEIIAEVLDSVMKVTRADIAYVAMSVSRTPDRLRVVEHRQHHTPPYPPPVVRFIPAGSGLIGEVMRARELVDIPDVRREGRYLDSLYDSTAAVVCVPIIHKGEAFGALALESQRVEGFTASQRGFVTMLAAHVAVALYNVRLFTDRQTQLESLVTLRDASLRLLSAQSVRETYALITRSTLALMRANAVHLYLYDSNADTLTFGANSFADGRDNVQMDAEILDSRTWRAARTGQLLLIPDTSRLATPLDQSVTPRPGSIARVPLKRGERVFGVLIISFAEPQYFEDSQIRTIDLIANQSVSAIENARLFEEVRTSRDQMQVILRSARDGMILLSQDTTLLQVNDAAEKLIGPIRQYIGRNLLRLVVKGMRKFPAQYDSLGRGLRQMIADARRAPDKPTRRTLAVQTATGARDVEETTLPVLDEHGSLAGRLIVLRDISEARAEERFREEVQQMLIHDLRAPASSMLSSLRLMLELLDMQEFTELKTINEIAIDGGERLLTLINSLLDIAKADALQVTETTLSKLLNTAVRTLEANARQSNIQVLDLTEATPRPLLVDETKMTRVFINLLDNALRHTPQGGEVRFVTAQPDDENPDFVRVGVIDTGKGIPAEYREKVFEKFIQVPKSALRGQRGTGLGLTFCKRVIEAHNGKIWVDSGPEGGAAFWLTLPLAPQTQPDTPPDGLPAPSTGTSA